MGQSDVADRSLMFCLSLAKLNGYRRKDKYWKSELDEINGEIFILLLVVEDMDEEALRTIQVLAQKR
jgi:hypothetical protein